MGLPLLGGFKCLFQCHCTATFTGQDFCVTEGRKEGKKCHHLPSELFLNTEFHVRTQPIIVKDIYIKDFFSILFDKSDENCK